MGKSDAKNCWEYWECPQDVKESCPAYLSDAGKKCYIIAGSYGANERCPKIKHSGGSCTKCEWFKIIKPKL